MLIRQLLLGKVRRNSMNLSSDLWYARNYFQGIITSLSWNQDIRSRRTCLRSFIKKLKVNGFRIQFLHINLSRFFLRRRIRSLWVEEDEQKRWNKLLLREAAPSCLFRFKFIFSIPSSPSSIFALVNCRLRRGDPRTYWLCVYKRWQFIKNDKLLN